MDANRSTSKQRQELTAKMTPEMCKAIKRQETNSGLNYWRTGFNNVKVSNESAEIQPKKATYRRLAQVNFDFPGLFLPNVDTQTLRQKRKDGKSHPIILNRTKTSFIPEIRTGPISSTRQKSDGYNSSKKPSVTDLTCLQLADTLLSYKSPFSGAYGTAPTGIYTTPPLRSRYMELFCDNKGGEDSEEQQSKSIEVPGNNGNYEEMNISTFGYHTYKPEDTDRVAEGQRVIRSPLSSDATTEDNDANTRPQTKPQKSILKNGLTKINRPSSETAISHAYPALEKPSACSYQLPGSKTHLRSVSETRLPNCTLYPKIHNDLRDFGHFHGPRNIPLKNDFVGTLRNIPVKHEFNGAVRHVPVKHEFTGSVRNIPVKLEKDHPQSGTLTDTAERKRSVRFNAAHEVREYAPCEPISFC